MIVITNDFNKAIEQLNPDVTILKDELKVDDVREIKKEAYIAEEKEKSILIAAKKYNIFAQNALLKLLEEPPKNIKFILLTTSKYLLLDTILSRLPIEKLHFNIESKRINLSDVTNKKILDILKEDLQKEEIQSIIKSLLQKDLKEDELKLLNDLYLMLELNIDKRAILLTLLLMLKDKNENI